MRISSPFVHRCVRLGMFGLLVLLLTACGTGGSANGSPSSGGGAGSTSASAPGTITEFALPHADSGPGGITAGPDGNLWFIVGSDKIGRMTPTGTVTLFPLPAADSGNSSLNGITTGPNGNLWFTEGGTNKIGYIVSEKKS